MQAIRRIARDASCVRSSVFAEGAKRVVCGSFYRDGSSTEVSTAVSGECETFRHFSTSSSSKAEVNQRDEGSRSDVQDEEKLRDMAVQKGAKDMMGNILPGHIESVLGTQFCDITVKDGRSPIRKVVEDWFLYHWQIALTQFLQQFLQTRIESDFDLEEWLEGSKDAFWAVFMYGNTKEYRLLKPMLSDVLYRSMEMVFDEYNARELEYKPRLDDEIEARVCGIQFMSKKEMYKYVFSYLLDVDSNNNNNSSLQTYC